jgi:2,3-bisphosphoglycerate-dependent phosphoglycerate mutase
MVNTMETDKARTNDSTTPQQTVPVVLIRHAQSQWNAENRFTGWADPPLTAAGIAEAQRAGAWLYNHGYRFDVAYSSRLQRAITTLDILLQQLGQEDLPRQQDWRLNERHYGALQGVNKAEAAAQVGEQQVWRWRRGYADRATPLLRTDPQHPGKDPRYADIDPRQLPGAENLAQTRARVLALWNERVLAHIRQGQRMLISAHGNTLRALLMELGGMSVAEVEGFEIPTATPILYRFDGHGQPLDWRYLSSGAQAA